MVSLRSVSSAAALLASLLGLACTPFRGLPPRDGGPDDVADSGSDGSGPGFPEVGADQGSHDGSLGESASDGTDSPHADEVAATDAGVDRSADSSASDGSVQDGISVDGSDREISGDMSPPLPQLPKSGLVVRLEADYGIVANADDLVTKWRDESGNGFDATPFPGAEPAVIPDVNAGASAVLFGGNPGEGETLDLPTGFSDLQGGVSAFFVVSLQKITGVTVLLHMDPNGPLLNMTSDADMDVVSFAYHVGTAGTSVGRAFGFTYGAWHLIEVVQGGGAVGGTSSFTVFLDGTAIVTGAQAIPSTEAKNPEIGPVVDHGLLALQAALIYSRAVANDERAQIEGYLMKKWAIE